MKRRDVPIIWLITLLFGGCTFGIDIASFDYRLSTNVIPDSYNITIKPYLLPEDNSKRFTFDGEVKISLHSVIAGITEVTLHKDYISIDNGFLYDETGAQLQRIEEADLSYESETDKLTVHLQSPMIANRSYVLHFVYKGVIRNGMAGFYRANYTDAEGIERWIGITQSQRIDARTIFPCFDEPAMKATFEMHISRPRHYNALFNTRLLSSVADGNDRYMDHFEATPPMSTYLVAFVISEYKPRGDADFAIYTRPEFYNNTEFSHSVGLATISAYNNYTGIPYKDLGNSILQKVSSPKFPHNGMENWGLVIYKDAVLVNEPGYTDGWADKEYTITILVHETAHMWFGNSVTFAWWSYFWLNEAFARYYQYFLAHELYPEYQLDQQFVVNQVHLIFGTDAVNTTQPMTSPEISIRSPSEIGSKFSSIAYAKGASVVRMFHNIMGYDNFRNAIRDYLKENQLKNTRPNDLFVHLKKYWPQSPQVNLDEFFYDWTEQVGFPMLVVNVTNMKNGITLTQKRFLLNPDDGSDASLRYTIPITYTTDLAKDFHNLSAKFYMERNLISHSSYVPLPTNYKWVIFNLQQSNYYRVFYDEPILKNIQKALMEPDFGGIHVINRAQLVDDLFNFARVGYLDYRRVFEFLEYLENETEYLPWNAAFKGMQRVVQRLTVEQLDSFSVFLNDTSAKVYQKLGFHQDNDTVLDVYNRDAVVSWRCQYKDKDCKSQANLLFTQMSMGLKNQPSPDFRETVFCAAVRDGPFDMYDLMHTWYRFETSTSEKELLLRAMGCTRFFADYHYALILSTNIPQEHKRIALSPMYEKNPDRVSSVFNMIRLTVERLADALGSWSTTASVISDIANYFTTREQQEGLEKLIAANGELFGDSVETLHKAVKNVESNLQWAQTRLPALIDYLEIRKSGATVFSISVQLLLLLTAVRFLV